MSRRNKDQAGNTEAAAAEDTETLDVAAMFRQLTQQIADAARTSADAARTMEQQIADAARTSADAARTTEEAARASAEALRADIAEAARKSAEAARTTEEAARTSAAALRADIADAARTTAETLTAKLQEQSNRFEEQSRRLEEQIASQLRGEISRLEGGIDREVTAANGRIDELRREVERHNAAIADSQGQVGSQLSLLANRLDSVQRELYTRVQSVEAARSADSVATRDQLPLAPSPTPSVSGGEVVRKLKVRPHQYDGRSSWVGYYLQFETICRMNDWSPRERADNLAVCLTGSAVSVLTNLSVEERTSYDLLVAALNRRFNEGHSVELARVSLDGRRKTRNESLTQYGSDVLTLTLAAYPTIAAEATDVIARQHYVSGLDNSELRKQLKLCRPATLADMISTAVELEAIMSSEAGHSAQARSAVRIVSEQSGASSESGDQFVRRYNGVERRRNWRGRNDRRADNYDQRVPRERHVSDEQRSPRSEPRAERTGQSQAEGGRRSTSGSPSRHRRAGCYYCGDRSHVIRFCERRIADNSRRSNDQPNPLN
jgi:hypothetical protein